MVPVSVEAEALKLWPAKTGMIVMPPGSVMTPSAGTPEMAPPSLVSPVIVSTRSVEPVALMVALASLLKTPLASCSQYSMTNGVSVLGMTRTV